jgi:hypothetical protein
MTMVEKLQESDRLMQQTLTQPATPAVPQHAEQKPVELVTTSDPPLDRLRACAHGLQELARRGSTRVENESPQSIDKKRVLEWFTHLVIDNPDVEVISYGSGKYFLDGEDEKLRFDPQSAHLTLRKAAPK